MSHTRKISVIGLGYVGLPVAVAFGKTSKTIGFDINTQRVEELKSGFDRTNEVTSNDLRAPGLLFTADSKALLAADFHIIAVPTPVDQAKRPDMGPVLKASKTVSAVLKKGDIVVYESTVYPGATEEDCIPVLEAGSGLKAGKDFFVGYSPERINPGDREHSFTKIKKVVSGQDEATLKIVADVYGSVIEAGVFKASSIKVAEAAKVIENIQRDVNIALMNELALIFARLGIDTYDVLAASRSKWNFLPFTPGLVGGHCIGVDPYYLTHKAETVGYSPQVILSGRRINDGMGAYVASQVIKRMIGQGVSVKGSVVTILGLTFKENVSDIRNTKVVDIVQELADYGVTVQVYDPVCIPNDAVHEYGIKVCKREELKKADACVFAVAHKELLHEGWGLIEAVTHPHAIVFDVKGVLPREGSGAQGARKLFRL